MHYQRMKRGISYITIRVCQAEFLSIGAKAFLLGNICATTIVNSAVNALTVTWPNFPNTSRVF